MNSKHRKDVSFSVAAFYLKVAGFWMAANRIEEWLRNVTVIYTISSNLLCFWIQIRNFYFIWGDFTMSSYIMCNSLGLTLNLLKIYIIVLHKKKFLDLIVYMQKKFWHFNYDQHENLLIANTRRMCTYCVCLFTFFSQFAAAGYIIRPMISNIGKNESDRVFIFNMWLDMPLYISPYYEIMYAIQTNELTVARIGYVTVIGSFTLDNGIIVVHEAVTTYNVSICYLCVDNIICIICLHAACQFRILQYRLAKMPSIINKRIQDEEPSAISSDQYYATFKGCIRQHSNLIEFCSTIEGIFRVILLGQVLVFSALTSLVGYQVIVVDLSFAWRVTFVPFLFTNICQLWIFTYSCDCVTRESVNVSLAAYNGPWEQLPMDKFGKMLRGDLQFVMMRSKRPCNLTAYGFFPISLESFTKIMSTTLSYFTILNQHAVDKVDT